MVIRARALRKNLSSLDRGCLERASLLANRVFPPPFASFAIRYRLPVPSSTSFTVSLSLFFWRCSCRFLFLEAFLFVLIVATFSAITSNKRPCSRNYPVDNATGKRFPWKCRNDEAMCRPMEMSIVDQLFSFLENQRYR